MIVENLVQGSTEWIQFRKKGIGASDAAIIIGANSWRTREELLHEKLGWIDPQPINERMQRGIDLEPIARSYAENEFHTLFIPQVHVNPLYNWMYASLDGISLDGKILLEIKCTNKKNHELAKKGKIPEYYKPQLQHQMAVTGHDRCHYLSFDGCDGVVVIEYRDNAYIEYMIALEQEFHNEMMKLKDLI
jgi:putative phage-type endonuclease